MILKQLYLGCLSQASYLIGSDGEAAIVDPRRDIDEYLEEARKAGLEIKHILETHFHADFVSGHRELAARTGATIYFGRHAQPGYPASSLADGEEVRVGRVTLRTLETPGHTPESVCYLVVDGEGGGKPVAVLTGDTLFVGEVGRPDLMGHRLSAETMAGSLYDSLHGKLMALPDDVVVYPGHGPGSSCGRNIGPETSSTIGKERQLNYALQIKDRDTFVRTVAANLPAPPRYFPHDARLNREGPADLAPLLAALRPLPPREVEQMSRDGAALILDTRAAKEFGQGHLPGSVNIGIDGRYAAWVGTVLEPRSPFLLIAPSGREAEAAMRLARVGYDNVVGYLDGGVPAWQSAGLPLRDLPQIDVLDLARRLDAGSVRVVDVRGSGEWELGHIASATHVDLQRLAEELKAPVERGGPIAVICGSGYRSSIACSILERAGVDLPLMNVVGGMAAWNQAQLPVAR
jgi:glyoxylase-like metal-dependent hydrolase (beta-lactamase superfamily II)